MNKNHLIVRTLTAATLAVGALGAHAASWSHQGEPMGYNVSSRDIGKVQVGQTQQDVRSELGRPAREQHFNGTDTTLWRYGTPGTDSRELLVEFNSQGAVTSVNTTPAPGG